MELPSVAGEDGDDCGHLLVELGVDAETAIQRTNRGVRSCNNTWVGM